MSWFPQITSCSCLPFVPGVGTPKAFKVGSRGRGRAFCAGARSLWAAGRTAPLADPADPEGVDP